MSLGPLLERVSRSSRSVSGGSEEVLEMELPELVDLIHQAAADPSIVALQGTFGQGFQFSVGGYAQLEEIRNAIRLFQQSHRIHTEPNHLDDYDPDNQDRPMPSAPPPPVREPKYTFAYAVSTCVSLSNAFTFFGLKHFQHTHSHNETDTETETRFTRHDVCV
jgi:hypothetical protein